MSYDPDQYQADAMRTASNNGLIDHETLRLKYSQKHLEQVCGFTLGLTGESGEVADYLKKVLFHGHPFDKSKLTKELGDVQWYIAAVADLFDIKLADVMSINIEKLRTRYPEKFTVNDSIARVDHSIEAVDQQYKSNHDLTDA